MLSEYQVRLEVILLHWSLPHMFKIGKQDECSSHSTLLGEYEIFYYLTHKFTCPITIITMQHLPFFNQNSSLWITPLFIYTSTLLHSWVSLASLSSASSSSGSLSFFLKSLPIRKQHLLVSLKMLHQVIYLFKEILFEFLKIKNYISKINIIWQ